MNMKKIPNLACRLNKSIYGLKKPPRSQYDKLSSYLLTCNFRVSSADPSLFNKNDGKSTIIILVFVDDIIVIKSNYQEMPKIKKTN